MEIFIWMIFWLSETFQVQSEKVISWSLQCYEYLHGVVCHPLSPPYFCERIIWFIGICFCAKLSLSLFPPLLPNRWMRLIWIILSICLFKAKTQFVFLLCYCNASHLVWSIRDVTIVQGVSDYNRRLITLSVNILIDWN